MLNSRLPVIRMPVQMHDCGNDDGIRFDKIDEAEGKTAGAATPMVGGNLGPSLRLVEDALNGALDFFQKFQSQTRRCLLVIRRRFGKFALGW